MSTASGYRPWDHPSPLLDAIGGFEQHKTDSKRFGFTVDEPKVNSRGLLAGAIAAIGDVTIGHFLAAIQNETNPYVTVDLSCKLVGTARIGEWVEGVITPITIGRRLAAGTATFYRVGPIAIVTALFVPTGSATRACERRNEST